MKKVLVIMLLGIAFSVATPCVLTAEAQIDSLKVERERQQAEYNAQNEKTHRYIWLICGTFMAIFVGLWAYRNKSTFLSIVRVFTGGFRTSGDVTTQEDAEKAYSQVYNLKESIRQLKELKIINHTDEIEKYGVDGWDTGRLIFIARLCRDARYITDEEAWEYIDVAYAQAQRKFNSWTEIANSYIIGRFLWNGTDTNDGMTSLAEDLITKRNSPWQQVVWK